MRLAALAIAAVGCGRLGFEPQAGDAPNTMADASLFVEPRGVIDPSFGVAGELVITTPNVDVRLDALVPRGTGYAALAVHYAYGPGTSHFGLVGLTHAGELDPAFASGGIADLGPLSSDYGYGAAVLDADHLLLTGDGNIGTSDQDDVTVGIVDLAGIPDPAFGTNGFARFDLGTMGNDTSTAVAVGTRLLSCGVEDYDLADSHFALVGYDRTGVVDSSFGANGIVLDDFGSNVRDECVSLALAPSGVAYTTGLSAQQLIVSAYDTTGARLATFTPSKHGTSGAEGHALALAGTDIVAAGEDSGRAFVVRVDATGAPVAGFGTNGEVAIAAADLFTGLAVQPDGKLVLVGGHAVPGGTGIVARLLADGSLDPTFGVNGVVAIQHTGGLALTAVYLEPDGHIVVAGVVTTTTPDEGYIARFE